MQAWIKGTLTAVLVACGASAVAAAAGNPLAAEIAAARVHAGAAVQIDTVAGVHLHLHHVLNCVLGSANRRYDAKAEALSEHPCRGLGRGALADAGAHASAVRAPLRRAAQAAERGIASADLGTAHQDAAAADAELQAAERALK